MPVAVPFTNHWYVGVVPPFVGTAVNVDAVVVLHTVSPSAASMLTEATIDVPEFTVTSVPPVSTVQPDGLAMIQV